MKKLLTIISAIVLLSSCAAHRARICKTCPVVIERKDSVVYVPDTVLIQLPGRQGPTVYLDNPCKLLCDSLGNLKPVKITQQKNGQILHINTLGGGLNITSETKDTTAKAPVMKEKHYSSDKSVVVKCDNERTAFDGFARWFTYIVGGSGLLFLGFFFARRYLFGPKK